MPFYHRYVWLIFIAIFIIYNYLKRQCKAVVKNTALNSRLSGF